MQTQRLSRFVLAMSGAAALAGCGGSQPPIVAPGAMPLGNAIARAASAYRVLHRFNGHRVGGYDPVAPLIDVKGTLYGTNVHGGSYGYGTVYSINARGVKKTLHDFHGGSDGANPISGLVDVNGTLYGTTKRGGTDCYQSDQRCGTVFAITTSGHEEVIYDFKGGSDGGAPVAGLVYVNGLLYGTTLEGGAYGSGTVFSISTRGSESLLHSFGKGSDGWDPLWGDLIDVNGTLYGTTDQGGSAGLGVVYSITPNGNYKVLHEFTGGSDGSHPDAALIDVGGTLYGTTTFGGGLGCRTKNFPDCGTLFAVTTKGKENVLYDFTNADGGAWDPRGGLTELNGTFYGTTMYGGASQCGARTGYGCGTVYSVSMSGAEQVLHSFTGGGTDGANPVATLLDVKGTLYGTTQRAPGTVFALTP